VARLDPIDGEARPSRASKPKSESREAPDYQDDSPFQRAASRSNVSTMSSITARTRATPEVPVDDQVASTPEWSRHCAPPSLRFGLRVTIPPLRHGVAGMAGRGHEEGRSLAPCDEKTPD
jgi:hypothetical protein